MVIYCDFSGYSDVAIGLARWFGFEIPVNFDSPYQSKNITEFWRRWHISLSSWLRDYLYIPQGGNRTDKAGSWIIGVLFFGAIIGGSVYAGAVLKVSWPAIVTLLVLLVVFLPAVLVKEKKKAIATSLNQMNTMVLGGFWHGASINFIIWGAMHGTALAFHKLWTTFTKRHQPLLENRLVNVLSIFITFHFVCFCWIFFKASTLSDALLIIQQIGTNFHAELAGELFKGYEPVIGMLMFALVLHFTPQRWSTWLEEKLEPVPAWGYFVLFACMMWVFVQTKTAEQVLPIYLQF
jgi:D-alanyl-lipoteichoic acid acyltransferase DltB (MBOAT superfamily)